MSTKTGPRVAYGPKARPAWSVLLTSAAKALATEHMARTGYRRNDFFDALLRQCAAIVKREREES